MIKYKLTHPEILEALASAGHGSQVLIADGNYPFATGSNPVPPDTSTSTSPAALPPWMRCWRC